MRSFRPLVLASFMAALLIFAVAIPALAPVAFAQEVESKKKSILPPAMSALTEQALKHSAANLKGLDDWSSDAWVVKSIGYKGITEPELKWTHAIVDLELPSNADSLEKCEYEWAAQVVITLDSMQIESADYPTAENHECGIELGKGHVSEADASGPAEMKVIQSQPAPGYSFSEDIKNAFHSLADEMEQFNALVANLILPNAYAQTSKNGVSSAIDNDVATWWFPSKYYGNYAYLRTPQIGSGIYPEMDAYIAFLLNADFGGPDSTPYFSQQGWAATSINLCSGCNMPANSKGIVYVDGSTFGDLRGRNTGLTWVNGAEMIPETFCFSSSGTYTQSISYNSFVYSRSTNIPCTKTLGGDPGEGVEKFNISVFLENANSTNKPASGWAPHITTPIQARNAYHFKDSYTNFATWSGSDARETNCNGYVYAFGSVVITGSLVNGGTATWTNKNLVPSFCTHTGGGVAIVATDIAGKFVDGLYVGVYNPSGTLIAAGYTPLYVTALTAGTYNVDYANYGSYYFTTSDTTGNYVVTNWGGGRVPVAVTTTGMKEVHAIYYNDAAPGSFAKTTYKANSGGASLPGMFVTTTTATGTIMSRGLTPYTIGSPINQDVTAIWNNYGTHNIFGRTHNVSENSFVIASWGATQVIRLNVAGSSQNYFDQGNYS